MKHHQKTHAHPDGTPIEAEFVPAPEESVIKTYRSFETIQAVQYLGEPIPEITCLSNSPDEKAAVKAREAAGCDGSRYKHPHVHTKATGGMTVLKHGDWIFPVPGGPFGVSSDGTFRAHWEVDYSSRPVVVPAPVLIPVVEEKPAPLPVFAEHTALFQPGVGGSSPFVAVEVPEVNEPVVYVAPDGSAE